MRILVILTLLFICNKKILAQDTLPKLTVNIVSKNVIVSWTNPYTNLITLNIQRSFDSTKNFKTIGSILDVKNKTNGYVDSKPITTKMFYRVFLSFEGGTYLFTKSYRPFKDTTKVVPVLKDTQPNVITWFVPSSRVFTSKDNNVTISLPDAAQKKYTIKFFEENGVLAFEVNKIPEPVLTLEKVNFSHAGVFNFELYEDGNLIEKHKLYISKDGKFTNGFNEREKINIK